MTLTLTKPIARKILETVDAGLSHGKGNPVPGEMCIEAAVCYAFGLEHGDDPPCVGRAVRQLKISINDLFQGTNAERAVLLRKLSIEA